MIALHMKSIGARLALWYALAATLTFASLSVAGYFMLQRYLVHDLDLLNESEFHQIQAHLGPDHQSLSAAVIDERIRETTEYASVLFYIDVHGHGIGTVFRSTNLHGQTIPDVPHERYFNAELPGTGDLRVGEFILPPGGKWGTGLLAQPPRVAAVADDPGHGQPHQFRQPERAHPGCRRAG